MHQQFVSGGERVPCCVIKLISVYACMGQVDTVGHIVHRDDPVDFVPPGVVLLGVRVAVAEDLAVFGIDAAADKAVVGYIVLRYLLDDYAVVTYGGKIR